MSATPPANSISFLQGSYSAYTPISASTPVVSETTFEDMLKSLVDTHTGGRDWQEHAWPPGLSTGVLRRALPADRPLPGWRLILTLLQQLGVPQTQIPAFHSAYERAKLYRPWSEVVRIEQGDDSNGTVVINNTGTLYVQPERRYPPRVEPRPEPVIQDAPGFDLKPDPLTATSAAELEELARRYWLWAGAPSSREIATRSQRAFSHATIAKFIYDKPGKPVLKMHYLLGLIRGCGGDAEDQQRWVTAWRLLQQANSRPQEARTSLRSVTPEPGTVNDLAARAG